MTDVAVVMKVHIGRLKLNFPNRAEYSVLSKLYYGLKNWLANPLFLILLTTI